MTSRKVVAFPQMITGLIFYITHILLRIFVYSYRFTIIRHYIADFLALIVCIPLFANIQVMLRIRKKNYITFNEIIIYFLIFSIFFELISPFILKKMTFDPLDILFYGIGGLVLYFSQGNIK